MDQIKIRFIRIDSIQAEVEPIRIGNYVTADAMHKDLNLLKSALNIVTKIEVIIEVLLDLNLIKGLYFVHIIRIK